MVLHGLRLGADPWTTMTDMDHSDDSNGRNGSGGSGSELPPNVLWSASLSAGLATILSLVISRIYGDILGNYSRILNSIYRFLDFGVSYNN
jgi:hypothetical protein